MTARIPDVTLEAPEAPYFSVGLVKLAILSIASFGIYELFWFYQNWKREKSRTGESLIPWLRALFSPFFAYSLFKRVKLHLEGYEHEDLVSPGVLAVGYFLWVGAWRLPDVFWLLSLFSFIPLLPVQFAVNRINYRLAPGTPRNDHFTAANMALIVVGTLCIVLIIGGMLFPAAQDPGGAEPAIA